MIPVGQATHLVSLTWHQVCVSKCDQFRSGTNLKVQSSVPESERMTFHEFHPGLAADFFELNNDPEVMRFTNERAFADVEEAREFLAAYDEYKKHGFGRWALQTKEDGAFVGWCGLKFNEQECVDIGFRIMQTFWNRGLATEACIASLKYGFEMLGLEEIIGRAMSENLASHRVLAKAGMKKWKKSQTAALGETMYFRIRRQDFLGHE